MKERFIALTLPDNSVVKTPPGFYTAPGGGGLEDIILWVIRALFIVAITSALIFLLWGGIKWITSSGDKEKIESARKTIIFAIIGLVIVLLSTVIVHFAGLLAGVEFFYSSPATPPGNECIGNNCLIE